MHDDNFTKGLRGEFRGDFTRDTFDPLRRFSRVLMQQGRVQLDADWNEQVSIFSHHLRNLASDIIGPHGVPPKPDGGRARDSFNGDGFEIMEEGDSFSIHGGHYYVKGILCENDRDRNYYDQPDYLFTDQEKKILLTPGDYLVYLDVWERHLSYIEDDYMREKALNGSDTATRAKIIWQVKLIKHEDFKNSDIDTDPSKFKDNYSGFLKAVELVLKKRPGTGHLRARARKVSEENKEPCLISPKAKYRGAENQLYRVEIHTGGEIRNEDNIESSKKVTFKWSRENGSVIFPIVKISGKNVALEHLGRDTRFGLKPNDWVEIVDDDYILRNHADALMQIEEIDQENLQVMLKDQPEWPDGTDEDKHPYLRRWDQKIGDSNGVPVIGGNTEQDWILLEDGVEIQFPIPDEENDEIPYVYQTGDYWLIPARTATGDVEWPGPEGNPYDLAVQGVDHHYAPLANITVDSNGKVTEEPKDLRRHIKRSWQ